MPQRHHYRTVWLSDIHLGYQDCKADYLLDFLDHCRIDLLYLVGDIVDLWALKRQFHWPDSHNRLLHRLVCLPRDGTKVIYVPGNHDAAARRYVGLTISDIEVHREYIHTMATGKKLLLLHGDRFDSEVCLGKLHAWIGDRAYAGLLFLNRWYNHYRSWRGNHYWSLAGYLKTRVDGASRAIARYRALVAGYARERGVDGVVCGHIHHPELCHIDGVLYCNDGDWVENCSALTESHQGELSLVYWTSTMAGRSAPAAATDAENTRKAA